MLHKDCIFCQIIAGQLKSTIVWQDEDAIAIRDLFPQGPCHLLIIPKKHFENIAECQEPALLGKMLCQLTKLAERERLSQGFRLIINSGSDGGQTVPHLHIHLIGGRAMQWPPG